MIKLNKELNEREQEIFDSKTTIELQDMLKTTNKCIDSKQFDDIMVSALIKTQYKIERELAKRGEVTK